MIQSSPLLIAQVSDTHLFADVDQKLMGLPTFASFQETLTRLSQLRPRPERLLLTGDLSQDESAESYAQLQALLVPLEIPTYWLPGNHDSFSQMQTVLTQPPILSDKFFQAEGWQFLLLNSRVPGKVQGELSLESLEWLDDQLQLTAATPTLIGLHHPPLLVGSKWLDTSALQNPENFFAVIDRYPQVKLVIFGHIHQEFECQRRGVYYLSAPSTCIQFAPHSQDFSLDRAQPGFRLFALYPDGRFETKVERVNFSYQLDLSVRGY